MKKITIFSLLFLVEASILGSVQMLSVFAQTDAPKMNAQMRQEGRMTNLHTRADEEITRRINALNQLIVRIQAMQKLSSADKATLTGQIQEQITALTTLEAKIKTDTDLATLLADVKSITGWYRIFALIVPKGHLFAAADRMNTVSDTMIAVIAKIQTRIDELKTAGTDVTSLQSLLTDATAQVADAKVQAQAAITYISGLVPDQNDQAVFKTNKEALMKARADIKVGIKDLHTARKDIGTVIDQIKKLKPFATPQPSTSASLLLSPSTS